MPAIPYLSDGMISGLSFDEFVVLITRSTVLKTILNDATWSAVKLCCHNSNSATGYW